MNDSAQPMTLEPRWPIIVVAMVVYACTQLPGRVKVLPHYAVAVLMAMLVVPMLGVHLARAKQRWLQLEKVMIAVFLAVVSVTCLVDLRALFKAMVEPPNGLSGIELLNSSIAVVGLQHIDVLGRVLVDRPGRGRVAGEWLATDARLALSARRRRRRNHAALATDLHRLSLPCVLHGYFLRSHRSYAHDRARQVADDGRKSHLAGDGAGDRFAGHRVAGKLMAESWSRK